MSHNKSIDIFRKRMKCLEPNNPTNTNVPLFPNEPDKLYNYAKLFGTRDPDEAAPYIEKRFNNGSAIVKSSILERRIGIVGAGIAGTMIARELFKMGYRNITIMEGSDRVGGRLFSIDKFTPGDTDQTVFEMGAMRMPFFDRNVTSAKRDSYNSLFNHYVATYDIEHAAFPDPGQAWDRTKGTGIYFNDGYGTLPHDNTTRKILKWAYEPDSQDTYPVPSGDRDEILNTITDAWANFAERILTAASAAWNDPEMAGLTPQEFNDKWRADFWTPLTDFYEKNSFFSVAAMETSSGSEAGNYGGLGLTPHESSIFYVIGAGDGSWGSFYRVSSMYVIMTLMFGYGEDHQTIKGTKDQTAKSFTTSNGRILDAQLKGLNAFPYMNMLHPFERESFTDAIIGSLPEDDMQMEAGIHIYTDCEVNYITNGFNNDSVKVDMTITQDPNGVSAVVKVKNVQFDDLFVTASPWSILTNGQIDGKSIGYEMKRAMNVSHNIASCKVFLDLNEIYWPTGDTIPLDGDYIPQCLVTDTKILQVYGYVQPGETQGVTAISYTWEDDSRKLLSMTDDNELARIMLLELGIMLWRDDEYTQVAGATWSEALPGFRDWCVRYIKGYNDDLRPMDDFGEVTQCQVIHWANEDLYKGCSKLYSPGTIEDNELMYNYNQMTKTSEGLGMPATSPILENNIYFAGDMYSFSSGWTEGALRTAADALVWHMNKHASVSYLDIEYPVIKVNLGPIYAEDMSSKE
ncbi:MAG: hypothetical protein OFPII_29240 [Osedax symbiont Rs1]|nr:MAG: hypothetical protein OFPII_29240 [Osedax symbiont Rs1]